MLQECVLHITPTAGLLHACCSADLSAHGMSNVHLAMFILLRSRAHRLLESQRYKSSGPLACPDVINLANMLLCAATSCHVIAAFTMQGGVPKKHWDGLRREVLHTYGHEHILTLTTLQDAGKHHASLASTPGSYLCMWYAYS